MTVHQDSSVLPAPAVADGDFITLTARPVAHRDSSPSAIPGAVSARLHGFDLEERPQVVGMPDLPTEIVTARTTVPLSQSDVGGAVLVICADGNARSPVIVGVIHDRAPAAPSRGDSPRQVSVMTDDQRVVLSAEREIVLQCGRASITLTRAGKVVIQGAYILSRSSGYNRIKGAAVDIN